MHNFFINFSIIISSFVCLQLVNKVQNNFGVIVSYIFWQRWSQVKSSFKYSAGIWILQNILPSFVSNIADKADLTISWFHAFVLYYEKGMLKINSFFKTNIIWVTNSYHFTVIYPIGKISIIICLCIRSLGSYHKFLHFIRFLGWVDYLLATKATHRGKY